MFSLTLSNLTLLSQHSLSFCLGESDGGQFLNFRLCLYIVFVWNHMQILNTGSNFLMYETFELE